MSELETFSKLLEQETQQWIDEEIGKGNDAWNARRSFDGFSNIHWDMVTQSAAQINEHLACAGQNMTQGIFLCSCIQKHRPMLLQKSDGTQAETTDLVNCKPKDLKPWPNATIKIVAKNLEYLCLAELGCEDPGTAWESILKRDVAHRRAGNRQEAYHIAFLLGMTLEEMQRYFLLTRQEAFSLRDPLDIVCFAFKVFDAKKEHADSFRWRDVTDVLQGYLTACTTADAAAEQPVHHFSQKNGSTRLLGLDAQKLQEAMHCANDPAIAIPALRHDLQEYLVAHRHNLAEMKLERIHPEKLPPNQSRIEICMGYPYSHTVQRELSILVGYLLVLYGCWNTVVKAVYPKKEQKRRNELLLSSEKGAAPKLLSANDFMDVLSRAGRESLEPLKEAFQEKLNPDSLQEPPLAVIKPWETAFLMGQWLLRITPQGAAHADDFEAALQFLNDFLFCINGQINETVFPTSSYLASARNTSVAIWSLAGRLHCKKALVALIDPGPDAVSPGASDWAKYLRELGKKLLRVSRDSENFYDHELCGNLSQIQHSGLQVVLTSVSTYDSCRDSCYERDSEAKRYRHIQDHLEKGLPNLCYKIETTLHDYSPKAEEYAARNEQPDKKELDGWQAKNALASKLLSREDILQLFFFLVLGINDCYTTDVGKDPAAFTAEHVWLEAMCNKADAELGSSGTTGSFLEDALFASVFVELHCLWDEPKSDTVTPDQSTTICRIYNFLLDSLTDASGTTWHHIYYPAYTDRFYVLAGALAMAVPQSRRTLGLMMGAHRQKKTKPADTKKASAKAPKS